MRATDEAVEIDNDVLRCPGCQDQYSCLHQSVTRLWERDAEDADGTVIEVRGSRDFSIWHAPSVLIPGRRNSLEIEFWCEMCERKPVLRIGQHKGSTYIEWVR